MKFPYKKIGTGTARPIISIQVQYGEMLVPFHALIDSGADINIFPSDLADLLGIDIQEGIRGDVGGVTAGETQPYYLHQVFLIVGGHRYKATVAFMPTLAVKGHGLLGQKGFFDQFSVKFDYRKQEIEVKEHAKK